ARGWRRRRHQADAAGNAGDQARNRGTSGKAGLSGATRPKADRAFHSAHLFPISVRIAPAGRAGTSMRFLKTLIVAIGLCVPIVAVAPAFSQDKPAGGLTGVLDELLRGTSDDAQNRRIP